jgi:predicted transcriptional regulator
MNALYRLGKATASEIREALPDPPSYTAVRTLLTILEERGHVKHASDGTRYVYEPMVAREEMAKTAVDGVLRTFFDNSVEQIVATLLNRKERKISDDELERLARMIKRTREEGR